VRKSIDVLVAGAAVSAFQEDEAEGENAKTDYDRGENEGLGQRVRVALRQHLRSRPDNRSIAPPESSRRKDEHVGGLGEQGKTDENTEQTALQEHPRSARGETTDHDCDEDFH